MFLAFIMTTLIIVGVGYLYSRSQYNTSQPSEKVDTVNTTDKHVPAPKRPGKPIDQMSARYRPSEVGVRSDNMRVFMTNKGVRLMATNTAGLPMPTQSVHNNNPKNN